MPRLHSASSTAKSRSFLDTRPLKADDILSLFDRAEELEQLGKKFGGFFDPVKKQRQRIIFCLFLEPSTRTRLSFEIAAQRLGYDVSMMDVGSGSSRVKGESDVDTVQNIVAMNPDALVIRYNRSPELDQLLPTLSIPVISGGNATAAHPTQALLDAYTIYRERPSAREARNFQGERVLIVGDIIHSRVARSNFDVLTKLGAEIGVCGPENWIPDRIEIPGIKIFRDLDEAVAWPTVYMGLRVQLERHDLTEQSTSSWLDRFNDRFGLNRARLKMLPDAALIMHPGPINHGVEFTSDVIGDSRSRILTQVTNGILIRAALLSRIFGDNCL